jgi:hypothetical protein
LRTGSGRRSGGSPHPPPPRYLFLMRRIVSRTLAVFAAAWLSVALIEPAGMHTCAMHGGTGGHGTATTAADADPHAHHHAHRHSADTSTDSSGETPTGAPADTPAHGAGCTCLGDCAGVTGPAIPSAASALVVRATVAASATLPRGALTRPAHAGVRLPFAIGPPAHS